MTTAATWLLLGLLTATCDASCYFSIDLQGDYLMQSSPLNSGSHVQYSQVIITAEAISIWGLCHRRIGSNIILKDSLGAQGSTGTSECFRCVTLQPRSRNVIELLAESLGTCSMTEEVAQSNCPDERSRNRSFSRIILYKTKDLHGNEIRPEYCPINGRFTFIYSRNDDLENKLECRTPKSELDNCPSGAELNLHFRQCLSEHFDMTFQCLGHWSTSGNQAYLALLNIKAPVGKQPKYRCAMYRENPVTGSINMAFSRDSTCSTDLNSAISGYETVILTPIPSNGWPDIAYAAKCRFPAWAEGKWQHVTVENNTLTYIDHEKFKTYTLRCLDTAPNHERYFVFARTQCGEELYTCIWMKSRGVNVFEFQIGNHSSGVFNSSLCSDNNFIGTTWITQGRTKRFEETPCPIRGEYTGIIPDADPKLCAKLSSDCKSPEIMYYTVSECDISEIYEGSRIRIRNRRDSTTKRIYGINDPKSSTTTLPPLNQNLSENPNPPDFQPYPVRITNSNVNRPLYHDQISLPSNSHNIRYSPPHYSYNNNFNSNYSSNSDRSTTFSEPEEYDPWAYSKTNGFQNMSSMNFRNPRPDFNSDRRVVDNSRNYYRPPYTSYQPPVISNSQVPYSSYNYQTTRSYESHTNISSNERGYNNSQFPGYYTSSFNNMRNQNFNSSIRPIYQNINPQDHVPQNYPKNHPPNSRYPVEQENLSPDRYKPYPSQEMRPPPRENNPNNFHQQNFENPGNNRPFVVNDFSQNHRIISSYPREIPNFPIPEHGPPNSHIPQRIYENPPFPNHYRYGRRHASPRRAPSYREEREYRCLGHWEENGRLYTFTQRRDASSYECFVGSKSNGVNIKEAGEHCGRGIDPLNEGMKLNRIGTCYESNNDNVNTERTIPTRLSPNITRIIPRPTYQPTKPWKPITAPPKVNNRHNNACHLINSSRLILVLIYFLYIC